MHKRVKVCIRVRPDTKTSGSSSVVVNQQEQVNIVVQTISVVTNTANGNGTCFQFDQVLDAKVDQAGVFQAAASGIVESVLSGYNGTIMAYGQTGAGKTFTMSGGKQKFEDRGICARSISSIFQQIQRDAEHSYAVRVSYVEVYNENLYDLLDFNEHTTSVSSGGVHHPNNNGKEDLVIQENDKGQTFIKGLTRPLVKSEEDAFDLLFQGETNRTIAEHCLNASSTRSHCTFTIYLEKTKSSLAAGLCDDAQELQNMDVVVYSKLNLVDLAGSERMKKTGVSGTMLKEASHINKSLTFLEQVVIALGDKKRQHIPYRQTTLTNLLKDSLGGNCRTLLMACVWPNEAHNDQSLATLKFATRMMRVKTSAIINMSQNGSMKNGAAGSAVSSQLVEKYIQEIKYLKEELAMYDTLHGKSQVDYDTHTITSPARQSVYKEQVRGFLRDPMAHPLPILNLLQIQQLFLVFRDIYLENQQLARNEPMPRIRSSVTKAGGGVRDSKMVSQLRSLRVTSPPDSASSTCSMRGSGIAHHSTKLPLVTPPETHESEELQTHTKSRDESTYLPSIVQPSNNNIEHSSPTLSDKALFEMFKNQENPKPESLLDLDVAKTNLRLARAAFAQCGLEVNKLKFEIDGLSLKLQALRSVEGDEDVQSSRDGDQVQAAPSANNEQFFLVMQLKDAKKRYRDNFDTFQEKKAEVTYLTKIKDQMLQQLTREFETWKQQQGSGCARQ
uniref:Kinesin-like protein n=1 Tax=Globisporangium ultimum (strain ATCC 200006 / CBS 805.95 / DAOM BR144) TaxID=431595 RepID=K3X4Z1_GLOUD